MPNIRDSSHNLDDEIFYRNYVNDRKNADIQPFDREGSQLSMGQNREPLTLPDIN